MITLLASHIDTAGEEGKRMRDVSSHLKILREIANINSR